MGAPEKKHIVYIYIICLRMKPYWSPRSDKPKTGIQIRETATNITSDGTDINLKSVGVKYSFSVMGVGGSSHHVPFLPPFGEK